MNKYDEEEGATAAKPPTPMPSSSSAKEEESFWSWCTPCRTVILTCASIVTLAAASSGVFSSDGQDSGGSTFDPFDPMTWKLPDWLDNNPHGGNSPFDFNLWGQAGRRCQGLELSIIDNLDEKWAPYFQQAIKDWERGDPDVLSLSVSKASVHDPDNCEFVTGSMVVCNGDYGNTDWIGLNEVMIRDDRIIASVALMNDYHLDRMSVEAKQSTMCHELGHGFGLGHWDENFWNKDMGNCMDYTNTHRTTSYLIGATFCFLRECTVTLMEQASTISLLRTKVCTVAVPMKLSAAKFSRTDFLQKVLWATQSSHIAGTYPRFEDEEAASSTCVGVDPRLRLFARS